MKPVIIIAIALALLSSLVVPVAMAQVTHNITVSDIAVASDNPIVEVDYATVSWIAESDWKIVIEFPEDLRENFINTVKNEIQTCNVLVPEYNPNALSDFTEFNMCADENSNPDKFDLEMLNGIDTIIRQNEDFKKQRSTDFNVSIVVSVGIATGFFGLGIFVNKKFMKPKINYRNNEDLD